MSASTQLRFSNPAGVAPPLGRYSLVVSVPPGSRLIVLAGQVGMHPDGSLAEGLVGQFEVALANIAAILRAEGAEPDHLIKLNTWIVDGLALDYATMMDARRRVLGAAMPATTLAFVSRLFAPELLLELEAWAAVPQRDH